MTTSLKDKIILVFYWPRYMSNMRDICRDIDSYKNQLVKRYNDFEILFIISGSDDHPRIECINPRFIKEDSEEHQRILKIIEESEQFLKEMKENNDDDQ